MNISPITHGRIPLPEERPSKATKLMAYFIGGTAKLSPPRHRPAGSISFMMDPGTVYTVTKRVPVVMADGSVQIGVNTKNYNLK